MAKPPKSEPISYRSAGVDIDAGQTLVERIKNRVAATHRPEVMSGLGGFGGLFHLGQRFNDPVLVSGTDGVGTKLLLARQLNQHQHIGIDLVAMCVNDILVSGAEPLFFLDYFACGRLDVDQAEQVIAGIAEGCRQAGCALIGGETAEMPGMYNDQDYDLAGFAVGAVERDAIIDGQGITDDCVMIGLNASGAHSNGYSLIRQVLKQAQAQPEPELLNALMAPTRIYVPLVLPLLAHYDIRGMAHITGGGLTDNIIRVVPAEYSVEIDPSTWTPPALFDWLQSHGPIELSEMRRTFNMGIGFVLICPGDQADAILRALPEPAQVIGRIVRSTDEQRVIYL